MKTAICFTGTGKAIQYTFANLKQNVIDSLSGSDVIVYIADNSNAEQAKTYLNSVENTYVHIVKEEPVTSSHYLVPKSMRFEGSWPQTRNGSVQNGRNIFIKMLKSRSHLNTLIDQTAEDYDRVIFSRMDVLYHNPLADCLDRLDLSKIWLPNFHHWLGGYNDRFAVSSRENMRAYLSLYNSMRQYAQEKHVFHAEKSLKYHLDQTRIPVNIFELYFNRVGDSGIPREDDAFLKQALRRCDI